MVRYSWRHMYISRDTEDNAISLTIMTLFFMRPEIASSIRPHSCMSRLNAKGILITFSTFSISPRLIAAMSLVTWHNGHGWSYIRWYGHCHKLGATTSITGEMSGSPAIYTTREMTVRLKLRYPASVMRKLDNVVSLSSYIFLSPFEASQRFCCSRPLHHLPYLQNQQGQ